MSMLAYTKTFFSLVQANKYFTYENLKQMTEFAFVIEEEKIR